MRVNNTQNDFMFTFKVDRDRNVLVRLLLRQTNDRKSIVKSKKKLIES